jgi:hypothetical protein
MMNKYPTNPTQNLSKGDLDAIDTELNNFRARLRLLYHAQKTGKESLIALHPLIKQLERNQHDMIDVPKRQGDYSLRQTFLCHFLSLLNSNSNKAQENRLFCSVEEAAKFIGISRPQAYKLCHTDPPGLPVIRFGVRIRVSIPGLLGMGDWYLNENLTME